MRIAWNEPGQEECVMDVTVRTVQSMLARLSAEDLNTASKFIQFLLENHAEAGTPLTVEQAQMTDQSKEEAIAELRSLCHPGKHVWTEEHANHVALLSQYKGIGGNIWKEDPQVYVSALRSEEREL